jgi:hypothetical protein
MAFVDHVMMSVTSFAMVPLDSIVPVMDHQDLSASTLLKESSVFGIVQWEDMQ